MGRLFWKFFVVFMLAQLATVAGVSVTFWWRHGLQFEQRAFPPDAPLAFPRRGPDSRPELPPMPPSGAPVPGGAPDASPGPFVPRSGGPPRSQLPLAPLVVGIIGSLVFAAFLAWYVAAPIKALRRAFDAAAAGDLDVRVGESIGRRRDELADLGHAFDRTAARLKHLMDGQRRLLHDVSHELRSPLARLQAAIGLVRQQPDDLDASLSRIEREAARMDRLVGELLTLSRIETGTRPEEPVDIADVVAQVIADASFEQQANHGTVHFDVDLALPAGCTMAGSAEMLHRAIENVVRNAARFTPAGGRVAVRGEIAHDGHEVVLSIADDGPGVPAAELPSLFEPFFRGTGSAGTPGHGLGLAIARRVVELHGGRIAAANRAGGGLAVTVHLPCRIAAPAGQPA